MTFHPGEITVQSLANVKKEAESLAGAIGDTIKPAARSFLATQQFAVASTIDVEGKAWASLLVGEPGFIQVLDLHSLKLDSLPIAGDPFYQNLLTHPQIGILAIDLANRRRLRLNGNAAIEGEKFDEITIRLREIFFNCPKYIQTRYLKATQQQSAESPEILTRKSLNETDRQLITKADTFFIASFYADTGADASHREAVRGLSRS
jgi:uncharacterized protein